MQPNQNENEEEKETKALFEERDISKPDFKFVPGNHLWKQQGYYLVCHGCELQHAVWVGKDHLMVGVNDKGPILKTRKELNMA